MGELKKTNKIMLYKTQGIVLKQVKYNDSSKIITIFTKELGRKSFMVYGLGKQKGRKKTANIYQPLFLLNLEFNYQENKGLQKLKEVSFLTNYNSIPFNIEKTSIIFFLTEILDKIIKFDVIDSKMFDFISNSLQIFDLQEDNYMNFHLIFLIKTTKFLGFEPSSNYSSENKFFNISQAKFTTVYDEKYSLSEPYNKLFEELINTKIANFDKIKMNNRERSYILNKILIYYSFYIEDLLKLKSIKVLNEVFS